MDHCPSCHQPLSSLGRFCPHCGCSREQPSSAAPIAIRQVSTAGVSSALYLAMIVGGVSLAATLTLLGSTSRHIDELLLFSWMPLVPATIFFCVLLHRAWSAVSSSAPITAGQAVGFLFVPLFNFYWVFVGIGSWPAIYNAHLERNGIQGRRATPGLFIAYAILALIPLANLVAVLVLLPIMLVQICRGINHLAAGEPAEAEPLPFAPQAGAALPYRSPAALRVEPTIQRGAVAKPLAILALFCCSLGLAVTFYSAVDTYPNYLRTRRAYYQHMGWKQGRANSEARERYYHYRRLLEQQVIAGMWIPGAIALVLGVIAIAFRRGTLQVVALAGVLALHTASISLSFPLW
ncbi:MAG: zinc ribbon domain-containing protein [Deltaproteobacteria bacterium]|nr:zinc ribbon domain-containing protein [Deltaproteobacteria bacterium]